MALVSGSVDGGASYYWKGGFQSSTVYSRSADLTEQPAIYDTDRYFEARPERPTLSVPVISVEANVGGAAKPHHSLPTLFPKTELSIELSTARNDAFHTITASTQLSTSSPLLYRIQPSEAFEQYGMPIGMSFSMDAILGAAQYDPGLAGTGGLSLDYVVGYHIYRTIIVDGNTVIMDLGKERFEGAANVIQAGTFDRFQREFEVEAQIGDYMELVVELNGNVTQSAELDSEIHAYVGFDWVLDPPTAAPVTLGVTAQHNELDAPTPVGGAVPRAIQITSDKFGPYLPGVELQNKFTITVEGEGAESVEEVNWSLGSSSGSATRAGGGKWTFTVDMGDFESGEKDLIVLARDATGEVMQEHHSKVVHRSTLNFELKVDPGSSDELVNVEDTRFFQGVSASLQFEGTIDGLAKFYTGKSKVFIGNTPVDASFVSTPNGAPAKFLFTYNVSGLTPGPLGTVGVDVEFDNGARSITDFGDSKEPLRPVAKPIWLSNTTMSYNTTSGEYQFHNYRLTGFNYEASLAKTGQKWLDSKLKKLDTFAKLEAVVNIDAPLQMTEEATFDASQLIVRAQILGEKITDTTYSSGNLDFGGSLDAITLDPTGLSVRLKNPAQIANQTFLKRQFSFNLVDKIAPGLPEWLISARFNLALELMSSLTVDAGVSISRIAGSIQYVSSGTFLKLTADPSATATAQLVAKVGGGWLADFTGTTTGKATIELATTANFSGAVTAVPKAESVSLSAKFKFAYHIKIQGTLAKKVEFVSYDSALPENGGPDDDVFGPYELLTLSTKPSKGKRL